jgi:hypothetical protein
MLHGVDVGLPCMHGGLSGKRRLNHQVALHHMARADQGGGRGRGELHHTRTNKGAFAGGATKMGVRGLCDRLSLSQTQRRVAALTRGASVSLLGSRIKGFDVTDPK